jgi:hypothetical protein
MMSDAQKGTTLPGPDKSYRFRSISEAEQEEVLKSDEAPPPTAPFNENEGD